MIYITWKGEVAVREWKDPVLSPVSPGRKQGWFRAPDPEREKLLVEKHRV